MAWWLRLAALLLLLAGSGLRPAAAGTYTFRSDNFTWETASNAITWDRTCTSYPGDDDKATISFTGGFKFNFNGSNYTSVTVLTNGSLQFGADTGFYRTFTNTTLPAGTPTSSASCAGTSTTNVLMAYWTDLNPSQSGSGNVTWQQKGSAPNRYVVVSWNGVYQYSTSTPYAFQVILYENGDFKYQYGNNNSTGSNATIGVQISASDYTQYSYNSGYNANGSAIRWFIPSGTAARKAEYRMDEYSWNGTVGEVTDSSGNGQNGTAVGSVSTVSTGKVCRALDVPLNTTTAIAAVDTALDVDSAVGNTGTMSFWVRSNVAWTDASSAMLASATTSASRPFFLQRNGGGALRFTVSDSAGTTLTATTAAQTASAGTWVHVAATWRFASGNGQSVLRIYVNGLLATSTSGTTNASLDPSHSTLFIGDNRSSATPTGATTSSANGQIDEMRVYNFELSAAEVALDIAQTHTCAPPLHHVEIRHGTGTGVTCTPSTLTVMACLDASCATPYTGGLTGTLTASGTGATVNWPSGASFTIGSGSSSTTVPMQVATASSVTLGTTSLAPTSANATSCNFGSPSCTFTAADSGLVFDVPDHRADAAQTVTVSAVRKSDSSAACVPAFASTTKSVTFACSYQNPSTGTLPVRVGGSALNASNSTAAACDAGGRAVSLAFDASGVATTTVQYADAGQVQVSARYAGSSGGETGLVMTGTDSFIAAPASFAISGVTAAPIRAGAAFGATVTARNSSGAATPNFGRETPAHAATMSFTRAAPTGAGASNGTFTGSLGSFSSGAASATNLVWSEVGTGDLGATLTGGNYLGSGMTVSGSTGSGGAVGRFIPHHFDVSVTAACGAFSYAGQPFTVRVTARNGLTTPTTTVNYDGSALTSPTYAKAVTLADTPTLGLGSFNGTQAVAATAFTSGVATVAPAYAFTTKQTMPQTLVLRATDGDGVSSSGYTEGSTALRSGRLQLAGAFGSEKQALGLAVQVQYWSGQAWVRASDDTCTTTVPAAAVARSGYRDGLGNATSAWSTTASAVSLSAGAGTLSLSAPSPAATGSVDIALNLGGGAADQSCLGNHPATTGAGLTWLRSLNGSCATTADRDPSARASFGIFAPETRKTIHVRDLF